MTEAAAGAAPAPPLHPLPQATAPVRPPRSAYSRELKGRALVIDNGSYACRAGWGGEDTPRAVFRAQSCRARCRANGEVHTCVGEWGAGLKGWEFGRARSAFESSVVVNWDAQEAVLDWALDRLGLSGSAQGGVPHPVLVTEALLNPPSARAAMAELLFEAYGVPEVRFTTDALAAFAYNRRQGRVGGADGSGIVVSCGHGSTTILPILRGVPQVAAAARTSVSSLIATEHLQRRLTLRHPQHSAVLTPSVVSALREEWCYCAPHYSTELEAMRAAPETAGGKAVRVQLPWTPPVVVSEEELAAQAAAKAARVADLRERMKAMSAAQRRKRVEEKTAALELMLRIDEQLADSGDQPEDASQLLAQAGVRTHAQLRTAIRETQSQLAKWAAAAEGGTPPPAAAAVASGADDGEEGAAPQGTADGAAREPAPTLEVQYPLLGVADEDLDEEGRREKKRQRVMKASTDARAKAAERRRQQQAEKEEAQRVEEEQRAADPEGYAAGLRERHSAALARMEARRRRRLGISEATGPGAGVGGRATRVGAEQRHRMRMLAEAAFGSGNESDKDDGFGADDRDWQVYRHMDRDGSDSDSEADEADERELRWTSARMKQLGLSALQAPGAAAQPVAHGAGRSASPAPALLAGLGAGALPAALGGGGGLEQQLRPPVAEDYQLFLGVERVQVPELLFQPSIAGIDQAGLTELIMTALRRLGPADAEAVAAGGVLLCGGHAGYAGLAERLEAELTTFRPMGRPMPVVRALDLQLDAWRGASLMAAAPGVFSGAGGGRGRGGGAGTAAYGLAITRKEYEERGVEHLKQQGRVPFYV